MGLALRAKNRDLRERKIIENRLGHKLERPPSVVLEDEEIVIRTNLLDFRLQRCRDGAGCFVGNDGNPLLWPEAQADADGVTRAWNQFSIDGVDNPAVGHKKASVRITRKWRVSNPSN